MENKSEYNDGLNHGRNESATKIERLTIDLEKFKDINNTSKPEVDIMKVLERENYKRPWCCPDA